MVSRFRMIAGPNGSGKSTLRAWLAHDYAVNFYNFLNADDILAEVVRSGCYFTPFPVEPRELIDYASRSSYPETVTRLFTSGRIFVGGDCIRFASDAVNSYSIALVTAFLQSAHLDRGLSFSRETVFSHPSKIDSLKAASDLGYKTYLYFVSTNNVAINVSRVKNRVAQGGHDVPADKVVERYARSIGQIVRALPFLSRAFFFDNSGVTMRYLAHWNKDEGMVLQVSSLDVPKWFGEILENH
ncbi:MAG: hypothetical protein Q4G65_09315 [bacterium]|nr:hypothetical protein [bacterium]